MNNYLMKVSFILGLVLSGCCPSGGIDRSYTVNEYAVAIDYYSQGTPIEANLVPKNETYVELFDNGTQSEKPIYSEYDDLQNNRIIYYFNSNWNSEKIKSFNVKFSDFELNSIDFNTAEKAAFLRDTKPLNQYFSRSVSYLDQIECVIKSVTGIFLPQANAMSCKASDSSMVSYRAGTLIRVNLD